jgi:hypothetical protein
MVPLLTPLFFGWTISLRVHEEYGAITIVCGTQNRLRIRGKYSNLFGIRRKYSCAYGENAKRTLAYYEDKLAAGDVRLEDGTNKKMRIFLI